MVLMFAFQGPGESGHRWENSLAAFEALRRRLDTAREGDHPWSIRDSQRTGEYGRSVLSDETIRRQQFRGRVQPPVETEFFRAGFVCRIPFTLKGDKVLVEAEVQGLATTSRRSTGCSEAYNGNFLFDLSRYRPDRFPIAWRSIPTTSDVHGGARALIRAIDHGIEAPRPAARMLAKVGDG